jgi:TonB family protein
MKQAGRIRLWLKTLAIFALAIISAVTISRAQEPVHEPTPSAPATLPSPAQNGAQILTPTGNVKFDAYIQKMHQDINKNWTASLPDAYLKGAKGASVVRFRINWDGTIQDISLDRSSGNDSLDQAAINAIRNSSPVDPLPSGFKGPYIALLSSFQYNLSPSLSDCNAPAGNMPPPPPFDRLELLAFLAGQGPARYETQVICQRGIDFAPDSVLFLALQLSGISADFVKTLGNIKPRSIGQPSPDRISAYDRLRAALGNKWYRQFELANQEFVHALEFAPDSATLHLAYARNLLLVQNYSEAEVQSRLSLKLWPEDASAHVSLAMALLGLSRNSEATTEAHEALRIFPNDQAALVALGFSLAKNQQYKEAIPVLQQALPAALELPIIRKDLGICMVHAGEFDAGIEQLTLFLKASPDDAQAHYFWGVALREKGQPDQAAAHFREAVRIEPNNWLYTTAADPTNSKESSNASAKPTGPQPDDCFFAGNIYTNTFFGFSYQFPKDWIVQKADAGKAATRLGVSIVGNGDPTMPDVAEALAGKGYELLFATKQTTKEISTTMSSIHITAMDKRYAPDLKSNEEFLNSIIASLKKKGSPFSALAPPEELTLAGRTFWKLRLDISYNNVTAHLAEVVTFEKNYILLFVFGTADASQIDQLVGTMQSLRFTDSSPP